MKYKVGFGRVDITPTESMPLSGMGITSKRMSRVVRDELFATCIAFTDPWNNTVLMYTVDLQSSSGTVLSCRNTIAQLTGVAESNIFISATHTHAGPHVDNREIESCERYRQQLREKLPLAAVEAMADRAEATLYMGQVEAERMNFVKHYYNVDEKGQKQFFGDNFGKAVYDETTRHATDADPTMHLLRAVREDKKDIVLCNFRAHPHSTSGVTQYVMSADFISDFREFVEKEGLLCGYYQGAAGNINNKSRLVDEMYASECRAYGRKLSEFALKGLHNMTEVACGPIRTVQKTLTLEINKPTAEEMEYVERVRKVWQETVDFQLAIAQGAAIGIRSPYQANAMRGRYYDDDTEDSELGAIAFGDAFAVITAPNELFDAISVYVEDHADFPKVLTFGYCNGSTGYIPTAYGFAYSCYESDCCHFKPGCGEVYRDAFMEMLRSF